MQLRILKWLSQRLFRMYDGGSLQWFEIACGRKHTTTARSDGSLFTQASTATFSRFMLAIKAKFDYGITIFILTFSWVAVSGYRVEELLRLAQLRVSTIIIGVSVCFLSAFAFSLFVTVKTSYAHCCVEEYFETDGSVNQREAHLQKSQKYKCVLNSKAFENSLQDGSLLMATLFFGTPGANTSKLEPQCNTVLIASKLSMVASTQRFRSIFNDRTNSPSIVFIIDVFEAPNPPNQVSGCGARHMLPTWTRMIGASLMFSAVNVADDRCIFDVLRRQCSTKERKILHASINDAYCKSCTTPSMTLAVRGLLELHLL